MIHYTTNTILRYEKTSICEFKIDKLSAQYYSRNSYKHEDCCQLNYKSKFLKKVVKRKRFELYIFLMSILLL